MKEPHTTEQPPDNPMSDLIPVATAIRILPSCRPGKKVALSTVYRWIDEGRLEGVKIGRWTFVYRSQVLELLKPIEPRRRKVPGPSAARQAREQAANDLRTRKLLESFGLTY